jgi:hypothetical protein
MTSKRAAPVWLTAIWEQRRKETATRIARAVTKLRSDGCEVTYSSICAAVRAIDGISISRMVKIFKCAERSRSSMMDVEDEHNQMRAAFGLRYRFCQPGTPAAE